MHTRIALGTFLAALISLGTAYGQRGVGEQIDVARQVSKPELVTLKGKVEGVKPAGTYEHPIALVQRKNVNVVYQIKTGGWKNDVAAGLHYLNKLAGAYDAMGISPEDRRIVGVFHGDAGYFLVKDPAYRKAADKPRENPNKEIVQKLLDAGVQLDLCKSTMENHGWTGEDVLPGVKIVVGAYPRIIDLQLRGYAYIRF